MTNAIASLNHLLPISLFVVWGCFASCNGQAKTNMSKKTESDSTTIFAGQPKLISNLIPEQYAHNVHCGIQDKSGNLWFGTTGDGLYRYDGKVFTNFTTKDGLNSNAVWHILEDTDGNIWLGTDDGICRYDGKTFTNIPIAGTKDSNPQADNLSNNDPSEKNAVWSIMQDKSGKLWFGTDEGVYCYNGKVFTLFLDNKSIVNPSGFQLKRVEALLEDKKGNVWFASWDNEGICRYDGKSLTNFKPDNNDNFKRILEDKNGNLWFASRSVNVFRYDGKTFTNFTEKEGLTNITCIIEDKAGNIWFGGDNVGGLWRYDGKSFTKFSENEGLTRNGIWSILEDKNSNLWLGTRNTGLYRYDGKTFTTFSE